MVSQRDRASSPERCEPCRLLPDEDAFHYAGQSEPMFLGSTHGVPNRMDRRKGLGNAIVPQVAYEILNAIKQYPPNALSCAENNK